MTEHTRRTFLAFALGTAATGAGCITDSGTGSSGRTEPTPRENETTGGQTPSQTPSDEQSEVASLSFDHAEPLHRIDAGFPQRDVGSYYLGLLTSRDHVAHFPTTRFQNQTATAFLEKSDYSRSVVLALQDRRSSSHPDLELHSTERNGPEVSIETRYPGQGGTADVTSDTLLVRIPTDGETVRFASATITPQYGDPVRLATGNAYDADASFDSAGDLVLQNRDCANAPLSVTVTFAGDLFLRDGLDLQPATRRRIERLVAYPGEWTVTVRTGSRTIEHTWSLADDPPGDVLLDVTGEGTVSMTHEPSGVDRQRFDTCQTNGYPYESPTPSENLVHPIDLLVLDHAEGEHHLTVRIRDGDTDVFSGDFDTRSGYDKIRRAGLLAKKTAYTVDVTTGDGAAITETVTVRDGVKKLAVRIPESGELTVSIE